MERSNIWLLLRGSFIIGKSFQILLQYNNEDIQWNLLWSINMYSFLIVSDMKISSTPLPPEQYEFLTHKWNTKEVSAGSEFNIWSTSTVLPFSPFSHSPLRIHKKGISTKNIEYDTQNSIFVSFLLLLSIDNLQSIDCSHRHSFGFLCLSCFLRTRDVSPKIDSHPETLILCSSSYG